MSQALDELDAEAFKLSEAIKTAIEASDFNTVRLLRSDLDKVERKIKRELKDEYKR